MRPHRFASLCICLILLAVTATPLRLVAAENRIVKVLPHLLDQQGRHALSPSLYERDAYQAQLRKHPDQVSALRFDIHWRAARASGSHPVLRLELRTATHQGKDVLVLESPLPPRGTRGWTPLTLDSSAYHNAGEIQAWRATLQDGVKVLAESKSFLW